MKKILIILQAAVFCSPFLLFTPVMAEESAILPENPAVYEASGLWQGIEDKTLSFEFDDPVTVTGIVTDKGISKYATPYVTLSDKENGKVYAVCVLPRTDVTKLSNFTKGLKVTMSGNYYAVHDRVVIKKCKQIK